MLLLLKLGAIVIRHVLKASCCLLTLPLHLLESIFHLIADHVAFFLKHLAERLGDLAPVIIIFEKSFDLLIVLVKQHLHLLLLLLVHLLKHRFHVRRMPLVHFFDLPLHLLLELWIRLLDDLLNDLLLGAARYYR